MRSQKIKKNSYGSLSLFCARACVQTHYVFSKERWSVFPAAGRKNNVCAAASLGSWPRPGFCSCSALERLAWHISIDDEEREVEEEDDPWQGRVAALNKTRYRTEAVQMFAGETKKKPRLLFDGGRWQIKKRAKVAERWLNKLTPESRDNDKESEERV